MIETIVIFILALSTLLFSARIFTKSAELIGQWIGLPTFIIGVFIVGIGTSLPELISGILSVRHGSSEILSANIMGANISNILMVTGLAVLIGQKNIQLGSFYIAIDLHFMFGAFLYFLMISYDGRIDFKESIVGLLLFLAYAFYLIKGHKEDESKIGDNFKKEIESNPAKKFPLRSLLYLLGGGMGIYFGANYTVSSLGELAIAFNVPASLVSLTLLSLGTTLPELVVNILAIRAGNSEMAIGSVMGSCVFNTLMIPSIASWFGTIAVPDDLIHFSLPVMIASGLFFYLITQDKKISIWEGAMFFLLYLLFILKVIPS